MLLGQETGSVVGASKLEQCQIHTQADRGGLPNRAAFTATEGTGFGGAQRLIAIRVGRPG